MIGWIYDTLLSLHPAEVREQFGPEMRRVFRQARADARQCGRLAYLAFCLREITGMVGGLMGIGGWLHRYRRWIMACAFLGAVAGGSWALFESQQDYVSTGTLVQVPPQIPASVVEAEPIRHIDINRWSQGVLSRASLVNVINSKGLYLPERSRLPMEDIVERMRSDISISSKPESGLITVKFRYHDRVLAQKVTQDILSRLIDEVIRSRSAQAGQIVDFLHDKLEEAARDMDKAYASVRDAQRRGESVDRLNLDASMALQHYESLRKRHAEARMRRSMEERKQGALIELLDAASLPVERFDELLHPWGIPLAAAAGLLTGCAAALLGAWLHAWWPRRRHAISG